MSKEIKFLIEQAVENALEEQNVPRRELATKYVKAIKRKNPKLHDMLMRQALYAIKSLKDDVKPRETVDDIHKLLRMDPDTDPRKSGDTHGVRLFIDHLIDDTTFAGRAKRFYQQILDSLLKSTYGEK